MIVSQSANLAMSQSDSLTVSEYDSLTVAQYDNLTVSQYVSITVSLNDIITLSQYDSLTVNNFDSHYATIYIGTVLVFLPEKHSYFLTNEPRIGVNNHHNLFRIVLDSLKGRNCVIHNGLFTYEVS